MALAPLTVWSQQPVASPTIALRAARFLNVETGTLVTPGVLLVEGDRIRAVNPTSLPPGTRIVELGDRTLLPGLIDLHVHLTMDYEGDWFHRPVDEDAGDEALRGVPNARRTLMAGFTTVRNVGAGSFTDVALMRAIASGRIDGPRVIPAGYAIGTTGGHCDITGFIPGVLETTYREGVADGPDALIRAVRYQVKHGAQVVKICATAGVMSLDASWGAQQLSDAELRAIVEEARRLGIRVAAHAHGTAGIIAASRAGVTSIEHGTVLNEEAIRALIENGTWLVPTAYTWTIPTLPTDPPAVRAKTDSARVVAAGSLRAAITAGVRIAFGTDAGTFPNGDNAREFTSLVSLGMSPAAAIQAATVNAAAVLGLTDRGVLAPGRLADVIAVGGNPLADIRTLEQVTFVMKGGVIYKGPEGTARPVGR
jgi:imidazolonepropionase-like amidohydrolase